MSGFRLEVRGLPAPQGSKSFKGIHGGKTWDSTGIGPNNERYPVAHGWVDCCKTCRWLPAEIKLETGL